MPVFWTDYTALTMVTAKTPRLMITGKRIPKGGSVLRLCGDYHVTHSCSASPFRTNAVPTPYLIRLIKLVNLQHVLMRSQFSCKQS